MLNCTKEVGREREKPGDWLDTLPRAIARTSGVFYKWNGETLGVLSREVI